MGLNYLQQLQAKRTGYTPPTAKAEETGDNGKGGQGEKKNPGPSKGALNKWFQLIREKLTGTCQCGCGNPSQKDSNEYYRHSCAHIFPKAYFPSVALDPDNYVERAFWGGCHTNMDERGLDKWPAMADWQDIRAKFLRMEPKLTREEKARKFYKKLKKLVYANPV